MPNLRRTRFYTLNYYTYHRDKACSYLRRTKKLVEFMQYEPMKVGADIEYRVGTGKDSKYFRLTSCPRCGGK